jgi:hypothetical protein
MHQGTRSVSIVWTGTNAFGEPAEFPWPHGPLPPNLDQMQWQVSHLPREGEQVVLVLADKPVRLMVYQVAHTIIPACSIRYAGSPEVGSIDPVHHVDIYVCAPLARDLAH